MLVLCPAICTQPAPAPAAQDSSASEPASSPLEVAGYFSFRYLNEDSLSERNFYREYSGSLFLSKTIGRWRFHSELNASNAPEYDAEGIHIFPRTRSLSVKLDSASINF